MLPPEVMMCRREPFADSSALYTAGLSETRIHLKLDLQCGDYCQTASTGTLECTVGIMFM